VFFVKQSVISTISVTCLASLILLSRPLSGGAITVSVSNTANLPVASLPGSFGNGTSACIYLKTPASSQCAGSPAIPPGQAAVTLNTIDASGSASATGPTDLTQSLTITANGEISSQFPGGPVSGNMLTGSSDYGFSTVASALVTNLYLFPSISINFAPGGLVGNAEAFAEQSAEAQTIPQSATAVLDIDVFLQGTVSASFFLDPMTNTMGLFVLPGDSGSINVGGAYVSGGPIGQSFPLINYAFQNSIVTTSFNSLGFALPAVGNPANFLVSSVGPFEMSFPAITDPSSVKMFVSVDQTGGLVLPSALPEPSTALLDLLGLTGFAALLKRRPIS
jgi:hypothetical protein